MKNDWTKQFKDKMDSFQEPVPENLWADLCGQDGIIPSHSGKKTHFPYFRYAGIAAAIVAISAAGIMLISAPEEALQPQNLMAATDIPEAIEEYAPEATNNAIREPYPSVTNISAITQAITDTPEEHNNQKPDTNPHPGKNAPENDEINENRNNSNVESMPEDRECDLTLVPDYSSLPLEKAEKSRFSLNISVSGTPGSNETASGYGNAISAASDYAEVTSFGTNPAADIRMFNRTREVNTDTKYFQPVKAGVTFRWYFSDRWSIGSGIVWSWLHSKQTSGSEEYYCRTTQNLHYIGIPVNINYDFWTGKHMRAYASLEAMAEKCIAGKSNSEYIYNGNAGPHQTACIKEKQLQWSASAKAGFQYDITRTAGIYIEPGASWHFKNGSNVENVYKARPVNFSLGIGARFSF